MSVQLVGDERNIPPHMTEGAMVYKWTGGI
jgi:hypothetical protein